MANVQEVEQVPSNHIIGGHTTKAMKTDQPQCNCCHFHQTGRGGATQDRLRWTTIPFCNSETGAISNQRTVYDVVTRQTLGSDAFLGPPPRQQNLAGTTFLISESGLLTSSQTTFAVLLWSQNFPSIMKIFWRMKRLWKSIHCCCVFVLNETHFLLCSWHTLARSTWN